MANAPICHVPVPTPIDQPDGIQNPSIPIATDLASALSAINAMRMILMRLANLQPRFDGSGQGPGGHGGRIGGPSKQNPNKKLGRWNEVNRTTEKVRVFNPQDKEQYVDVQRINSITMQDSITGEQWLWKR